MVNEFIANSLDELAPAAKWIIAQSEKTPIVFLSGEMGAGKTTLIRAICEHLAVQDPISSPTFSLVNEYQSDSGTVYHFDLYRIDSETELYDMGYEDYFFSGYLCLVEWPEKAPGIIPTEHVMVNIRVENDQRVITVTDPS